MGYTALTDRAFNALDEENWTDADGTGANPATLTITTDATAPISPSGIGRVTYPLAYTAGGSSSQCVSATCPAFSKTKFYLRYAIKFSANFQSHESGVNKIFYMTSPSGGAGDPFYCEARGAGALLRFGVTRQGIGAQALFLYNGCAQLSLSNEVTPTSEQAELTRGTWHEIELHIDGGTAGNADGAIHAWNNGVKILQYTNVQCLGSGWSPFNSIRLEPIWGGIGSNDVDAEMWFDVDHVYISTN